MTGILSRINRYDVTGTRQILAVACPQFAVMLEDEVKVENLDGKLQIQELSEIVGERVG